MRAFGPGGSYDDVSWLVDASTGHACDFCRFCCLLPIFAKFIDDGRIGRKQVTRGACVRQRSMKRSLLVVPALLLAALAGAGFDRVSGSAKSGTSPYHEARSQIVGAHLRQLPGNYILLMGDSHAESWFTPMGCNLPVVNAGLAGATAQSYSRFFETLALPRPPRAIILTIGTNNAQSRRISDPDDAVAAYRRSVEALLKKAGEQTRNLIVTPVPPLDPKRANGFSHEAALRFSAVLEETCRKQGCRFVDPFPQETDLFDGVHFVDYARAYDRIWDEVCPALDR